MKETTNKKKQIVLRVAGIALALLVICTFLSKTIYNMMLPKISTSSATSANLADTITYYGTFSYTNTQIERAVGAWKITEVFVKNGEEVTEGTVLFTVDMTDANLMREQLVINLDSANKVLKSMPKEPQAKLNVKKAQRALELHDAAYPKDGLAIAKQDGRVNEINFRAGDIAPDGSVICLVQTNESKPVAHWTMEPAVGKDYDVGDEVTVSFQIDRDGKQELIEQSYNISDRVFDQTSARWNFEAQIGYGKRIPLSSSPIVQFKSGDQRYTTCVPLGALTEVNEESGYIFTVEERKGVFGNEMVLHQHDVKILARNNVYAAIDLELSRDTLLMVYSSKAVTDGSVVEIE